MQCHIRHTGWAHAAISPVLQQALIPASHALALHGHLQVKGQGSTRGRETALTNLDGSRHAEVSDPHCNGLSD